MKFGFIVTNLAGGGAEKALLKLGSVLIGRGHEVHLVLLEHVVDHAVPNGIVLHAFTPPGHRSAKGILGKHIAAWRLRRLFAALAQRRAFDFILSTLPYADEVTIRARLPRHGCRIANTLSVEVARLRAIAPRKAQRRLARYRKLYSGRLLIAVSTGVANDLRDNLALAGARIERIYNPFDFTAIRESAQQPAQLPASPYVIHIGRFAAQKRHDLLLDAWALLSELPHRLVLLTEADERLNAMIAARGLGRRVTIAGFQRNPYPWIAGAELLVLSSDHEGLPNVVIEALALGTPVVSTDCPSGPREILGQSMSRCLVPVGDASALVGAIRHALADPPDAARVDLTPYSVDTVADIYERLAGELSADANDRR